MTSDERIVLVALDGSEQATRALPLARTVAEQLHARLTVICASDSEVSPDAQARLAGLSEAELDGLGFRVRIGSAAHAILRALDEPGVELVVLTTLAAGDPSRELGSVAREVAIEAVRPILILRPEIGHERSHVARPIRRILLPLDGETATAWALRPVTRLATHLGASVDVLYVATLEGAGEGRGSMGAPRYVDQPHHEWSSWTTEMRERLAIECAGCLPSANIGIYLRRGEPAVEIVRLANEGHYDAIALVRRSRLEPERARTLRDVIRTASCPLFVVGGGG